MLSARKRAPITNVRTALVKVLYVSSTLVLFSFTAIVFKTAEVSPGKRALFQENTARSFKRVFASLSEKTKVEVIQGDITDYSSVLEASRGAHVIVHMASLVDVWYKIPDSLIYSVNIKGEAPTAGGNQGWRGNTHW